MGKIVCMCERAKIKWCKNNPADSKKEILVKYLAKHMLNQPNKSERGAYPHMLHF